MRLIKKGLCLGAILLIPLVFLMVYLSLANHTPSSSSSSFAELAGPLVRRKGSRVHCDVHIMPWFDPGKVYETTRIIFYGKPIMQALKHICVKRGWEMTLIPHDTSEGAKELRRFTSDPKTFTVVYAPPRTYHRPLIQELAMSKNALVGSIRHTHTIAGPKKDQLTAFRNFFSKHGCDMGDIGIMPPSFIMDHPTECVQFYKYSKLNPDFWWIKKPSQGYGGEGITFHKNMSYFYRKDIASCQIKKQFIVQQYLKNMLLIEGRKFDVRGLILIAQTSPYNLFYHEGYLRLSVEKFNENGKMNVHLTNSHIQTQSQNFSVDKHFWSFQRFQDYLDVHHPSNDNFVARKLVPFIKKIGVFLLQTGLPVFERNPSSFHLLGLDFMVTDDFRVWFIEANSYPLWPKGSSSSKEKSFIDELMESLGNDMFDLLFELRENPSRFQSRDFMPGDNYKSLQMIWSEFGNCTLRPPPYNPCTEFT